MCSCSSACSSVRVDVAPTRSGSRSNDVLSATARSASSDGERDADADGDHEVERDGGGGGREQQQRRRSAWSARPRDGAELDHPHGGDHQHAGQRGQRDPLEQPARGEHDDQQHEAWTIGGDAGAGAGAHVDRGARDRAGGGHAAEEATRRGWRGPVRHSSRSGSCGRRRPCRRRPWPTAGSRARRARRRRARRTASSGDRRPRTSGSRDAAGCDGMCADARDRQAGQLGDDGGDARRR